jgi:hypothetical protein
MDQVLFLPIYSSPSGSTILVADYDGRVAFQEKVLSWIDKEEESYHLLSVDICNVFVKTLIHAGNSAARNLLLHVATCVCKNEQYLPPCSYVLYGRQITSDPSVGILMDTVEVGSPQETADATVVLSYLNAILGGAPPYMEELDKDLIEHIARVLMQYIKKYKLGIDMGTSPNHPEGNVIALNPVKTTR